MQEVKYTVGKLIVRLKGIEEETCRKSMMNIDPVSQLTSTVMCKGLYSELRI